MTVVPKVVDEFGVQYDSELVRDLYVREGELFQLGFDESMVPDGDTTLISIELNTIEALLQCQG